MGALLRAATPDQIEMLAPATPDWRVHDVLSHVVGITTDVLEGRVDGVATDAWTEAQVAARRTVPTSEVLAEWDANAPTIEPMIPSFGTVAGQMVGDAVTHEHDIRNALGAPGAWDTDAIYVGSAWMAQWMGAAFREQHQGLRIETDLWSFTWADGDPGTTLRTSAFELLRAATGRRSLDQIRAFGWEGTAHPELVVMVIFTPRAEVFTG